jgi:hypothetical protein
MRGITYEAMKSNMASEKKNNSKSIREKFQNLLPLKRLDI